MHRTATLTVTKTGASRVVHLNQVAFDALRGLPARIDGRLFPAGNSQQVSRAFRNACRRAHITDFRLHDTRHHFASTHAMNGTNGRVLQALPGHADPRMTARYSHLSDRSIQEAANRVLIDAAPSSTATTAKA